MKVKKAKWLVVLIFMAMMLAMVPAAFSATPVVPNDQMMYADYVKYGNALPINIANYTEYHHLRLDPANALGAFDAVQTAGGIANANFFGLAAREWTTYTFEDRFCNVDWATDIQFAEVTWGGVNTWHPEAAKVYLTEAIVDGVLQTEPYYVGVVWNRIGVNYISAADRLAIAASYSPDARELATSVLQTEGSIEITGFNLPAQVESAAGIKLIDITKDVYNTPTTSPVAFATYTNGNGGTFTVNYLPLVYPNVGAVTIVNVNPAGNTDGFDLDAIRVWKCAPYVDGDTATGVGDRIKTKGTWFMYNEYAVEGGTQTFDIQAGNPKDGVNIIGSYTITDNGDGTFTAEYDIDPTIEIDGWIYDIVVVDEHLAISQTMNFTAAPGRDDNADWGEPFTATAPFYVFAHFAVEYK